MALKNASSSNLIVFEYSELDFVENEEFYYSYL